MSVRSAQAITVLFTTRVFATGVATNADSLPTGLIYVNGTVDGATVTVTNVTTGLYKAAVTLPTLAIGDVVGLRINATVSSVTDNAIVWRDTKDVLLDSSGKVVTPDDQKVDVNTIKTQAVTCAAGVTVPSLLASTTNITAGTITTVTTVTNQLTAAAIATGVWQDTTAGDFTVALSVGKSLMNGVTLGTGLTVAAVSGAVGSVTARVTANTDQLAGQTVTAAAGVTFPTSVGTSTLTQTQVSGGAYAINSASFSFASALDLTTTQKASVTTAATAATPTAAAVTGAVGSVTGNVGGNVVGSVASVTAGVTVTTNNDKTGYTVSTVSDKTGYALTSDERTAIANEVEAQIIDETDSEKVLTAITDKIASVNPSLGALTLSAIAAAVRDVSNVSPAANSLGAAVNAIPTAAANATAVRTELGTELGRIDAAVTSRMATYSQPTGFLTATFPTSIASPTNITAGTIATVTTLTNLPAAPTDWLTAAAVKADAVTKIQAGLSTFAAGDSLTAAPGATFVSAVQDGLMQLGVEYRWNNPLGTPPTADVTVAEIP